MFEERFYVNGNGHIQDTSPTGRLYQHEFKGGINALCNLLNGFHNKNKRLEKENEELKKQVQELSEYISQNYGGFDDIMNNNYNYNVNKNCIECNGKFIAYLDSVDGSRLAKILNELTQQIEELNRYHKREEILKQSDNINDLSLFALNLQEKLEELKEENKELKKQVEDLEFALRTELAHQRVEKEEHSYTVYDFEKKLEKW